MRQCELAQGKTVEEYVQDYNSVCRKIAKIGEVVEHQIISSTMSVIYYNIPDEENKEKKPELFCCDCVNYEWGVRCNCTGQKRDRKDPACELYNIEVGEVQS